MHKHNSYVNSNFKPSLSPWNGEKKDFHILPLESRTPYALQSTADINTGRKKYGEYVCGKRQEQSYKSAKDCKWGLVCGVDLMQKDVAAKGAL